jgi:hypothetical protein
MPESFSEDKNSQVETLKRQVDALEAEKAKIFEEISEKVGSLEFAASDLAKEETSAEFEALRARFEALTNDTWKLKNSIEQLEGTQDKE